LFDPSAIRASEARPQIPDTPTRETTKATGPLVPATREYVVAPHEGATTTIYSAADADVQPPVMLYPSLPPTVFVARNADVTVINRMELVVSADGTVERVRLVNGPTRMPDMMLLSGAKLWKFSPATRNGEAVRYRVEYGRPLGRGRPAPPAISVRGPSRTDGPVGVLDAALGHAGHQLLGGRAADLKPVFGVDPGPVDKQGVASDGIHTDPLSRFDP